ncbi:hypothetical protein LTR53_004852 [Teratosphaeriaceae sp. CCFEE 6253]|nr:hypothetical protein LTR53_004852 [Teratosphaeriaceae sp. CCFEE 6253]
MSSNLPRRTTESGDPFYVEYNPNRSDFPDKTEGYELYNYVYARFIAKRLPPYYALLTDTDVHELMDLAYLQKRVLVSTLNKM